MSQAVHGYIQNYGAAIFLYLLGFLFACVVAYQMVTNQPINQVATGYIGLVLGYAINSHGISQGANTTNDTVAKTAVAQYPLVAKDAAQAVLNESNIASNTNRIDVLEAQHDATPPSAKE